MIATRKIRSRSRLLHRGEDGQAQIEFALTIMFVVLLFFMIFELIMFVYTYTVMADAAKEGVRYAVVHGVNSSAPSGPTCPCSAIDGAPGTGVVESYAKYSFHNISTMTVTADYNPSSINGASGCNKAGCAVRVTVSYPYQPLLGFGWPTVTVNAAAEGRIVF